MNAFWFSSAPSVSSAVDPALPFRRVASLIPQDVPIILESRVAEADIQREMDNAVRALDSTVALAIAGD